MNNSFKYILLSIVFVCLSPPNAAVASDDALSVETKVSASTPLATVADKPVEKLGDVKKIFIAPLGTDKGSGLIREKVIIQLMKTTPITIVESSDEADATLNGVAELNDRLVLYRGCGRTRYSAELLIRLTGKNKQLLWTDDVTVSPFFGSSKANKITADVANKLVKELTEAIEADRNKSISVAP